MLAEKLACIYITLKKMMIKSIYILITSLLSSEFSNADIVLNDEISVIIGIYMLIIDSLINKDTEVDVILVYFDRARSVEKLLNENFD